jgi:SAM-dependent methyltransferase
MDERHAVWFENIKDVLEKSYTVHEEPWEQSGFSGPEERWIRCRKPIADCIDKPGSFLDIGCANGYLIESMTGWLNEKGINIDFYGLDISGKLLDLAKQRLPRLVSHLFHGNAWTWDPVMKFDFVRTEIIYVPDDLQCKYIRRILNEFIKPDGKLLAAEYRSQKDEGTQPWINEKLEAQGFKIDRWKSGFYEGKELTRVAVIPKGENPDL